MSGCGCGTDQADQLERKTLLILLLINLTMFFVELVSGIFADSTGLISDSLDMLADAMVYLIALYAVGKHLSLKQKAARFSGYVHIFLGLLVLFESSRRFLYGSEPEGPFMIYFGIIALAANTYCLYLISKHRHSGIHMKASFIFSANDVLVNLGIIISGFLVIQLNSHYPDIVIGTIVSIVVIRGGILILHEAKQEKCENS